jgi:hypothetical protein
MTEWNLKAKRLLKSELVKRGFSTEDLRLKLMAIGVIESKSSIDSKISRGTFSAAFLLQCIEAIDCYLATHEDSLIKPMAAEPHIHLNKPQDE